jgi:hypothetical protein
MFGNVHFIAGVIDEISAKEIETYNKSKIEYEVN